jgi:hypothetical protein
MKTILILVFGIVLATTAVACERQQTAEPAQKVQTTESHNHDHHDHDHAAHDHRAHQHPVSPVSIVTDEKSEHRVTVYHHPQCGCCTKWVDHLEANGFKVDTNKVDDVSPIKAQHNLPGKLASCHTAIVDGYVVEGHVPAGAMHKLLKERPEITGIAVPGMPIGSPGMEGSHVESYDIVAYKADGSTYVFDKR